MIIITTLILQCMEGGCRVACFTPVFLPPSGRKIDALQPAQSITSARGHLRGTRVQGDSDGRKKVEVRSKPLSI